MRLTLFALGFALGLFIGTLVPNGEKVGPVFDPKGQNSIILILPNGNECVLSGPGRWEVLESAYPIIL